MQTVYNIWYGDVLVSGDFHMSDCITDAKMYIEIDLKKKKNSCCRGGDIHRYSQQDNTWLYSVNTTAL